MYNGRNSLTSRKVDMPLKPTNQPTNQLINQLSSFFLFYVSFPLYLSPPALSAFSSPCHSTLSVSVSLCLTLSIILFLSFFLFLFSFTFSKTHFIINLLLPHFSFSITIYHFLSTPLSIYSPFCLFPFCSIQTFNKNILISLETE